MRASSAKTAKAARRTMDYDLRLDLGRASTLDESSARRTCSARRHLQGAPQKTPATRLGRPDAPRVAGRADQPDALPGARHRRRLERATRAPTRRSRTSQPRAWPPTRRRCAAAPGEADRLKILAEAAASRPKKSDDEQAWRLERALETLEPENGPMPKRSEMLADSPKAQSAPRRPRTR